MLSIRCRLAKIVHFQTQYPEARKLHRDCLSIGYQLTSTVGRLTDFSIRARCLVTYDKSMHILESLSHFAQYLTGAATLPVLPGSFDS